MEHSALARLPGELRNRIWRLVLFQPGGVHLLRKKENNTFIKIPPSESDHMLIPRYDPNYKHYLSIAQTCSALRKECYATYFATNDFYLKPNVDFRLHISATEQKNITVAWKAWLNDLHARGVVELKRLVVQGPRLSTLPYDSDKATIRKWWKLLNEFEQAARTTTLKPTILSGVITCTFFDAYPWIEGMMYHVTSQRRCNDLLWVTINLPAGDEVAAKEEVQRVAAEKRDAIRSHVTHGCNVARHSDHYLFLLSHAITDLMRGLMSV